MKVAFMSSGLWPELTHAIRSARGRCAVAVAYFGRHADRLVPLAAGSRLVVNASKEAVGSGQTYPAGLLKLVRRGVRVFSVPNLHAKVFVTGSAAYVGSANASSHSQSKLLEAAFRTDAPRAVAAARRFVRDNCLHELSPEVLRRLAKLYKPPKIVGGSRRNQGSPSTAALPRVFLAQLRRADLSERDNRIAEKEMKVAQRRRRHGRGFTVEQFWWNSRPSYEVDDIVVQVTNEGSRTVLVDPPGTVIHIARPRRSSRKWFVHVEQPVARRRHVRSIGRQIGVPAKRLRRGGRVNPKLAAELLKFWG